MNKLKELKSWLKRRFETKIYKEDLEDIECIMKSKKKAKKC